MQINQAERVCRTCGQDCQPRRGYGYIDQCAGCARETVEPLVASPAHDPDGLEWEPIPLRERARLDVMAARSGMTSGRGWNGLVGARQTVGLGMMVEVA